MRKEILIKFKDGEELLIKNVTDFTPESFDFHIYNYGLGYESSYVIDRASIKYYSVKNVEVRTIGEGWH